MEVVLLLFRAVIWVILTRSFPYKFNFMRLTEYQQQAIVRCFANTFGQGKLYLFGSRTDNSQKGGDIDLYVIPVSADSLAQKKIEFLAGLKREIGEQKIDLVIKREQSRLIDDIAIQDGILLCSLH